MLGGLIAKPDNLRHTLLFASAQQILCLDHNTTRHLELAVQRRDAEAIDAAEREIERLPDEVSKALFTRFEELLCHLPEEARAA